MFSDFQFSISPKTFTRLVDSTVNAPSHMLREAGIYSRVNMTYGSSRIDMNRRRRGRGCTGHGGFP